MPSASFSFYSGGPTGTNANANCKDGEHGLLSLRGLILSRSAVGTARNITMRMYDGPKTGRPGRVSDRQFTWSALSYAGEASRSASLVSDAIEYAAMKQFIV